MIKKFQSALAVIITFTLLLPSSILAETSNETQNNTIPLNETENNDRETVEEPTEELTTELENPNDLSSVVEDDVVEDDVVEDDVVENVQEETNQEEESNSGELAPQPPLTVEGYFTDVPENAYYYKSLDYAIKNNLIGYDDKRLFNGSSTVKRMDVVHMLIQVKGLTISETQPIPNFQDVSVDDPNMPYIAAVVNAGLMSGNTKNQFLPNQSLTRAELAVILTKAYKLTSNKVNIFHDVSERDWYYLPIRALLTNGISVGTGNYLFKPNSNLNRAELIVFFVRAAEKSFRLKPISIPEKSCVRETTKTTYRVDVSVMNIWKYYNIARPVDAPSMTDPVNYNKWISSMSLSQKKWLVDRTDTQALYNDEVKILETRGNMYRVAAVDQFVPYNKNGYPGWVPKSQVAGTKLDTSDCRVAIVTADKAQIYNHNVTPFVKVSYSTILPVVKIVDEWAFVQTPNSGLKIIKLKDIKIFDSYKNVKKPTRSDIVREAKRFLNLPYLWAGTSSWGYDCSGIIYAVYRNFGIMIPRDSFYQATKGKKVAKKDLKPGDLIFFAYNGGTGKVYHVGIYISPGKMLHAPHYASKVQIESFEQGVYAKNYAGARSYLD